MNDDKPVTPINPEGKYEAKVNLEVLKSWTDSRTAHATASGIGYDKYIDEAGEEYLRTKVRVSPLSLTKASQGAIGKLATVETRVIDGETREIYTYNKGTSEELALMPKTGEVDIHKIIDTAKNIMDFADTKGKGLTDTESGILIEINFNEYLSHMGYKKREGGGFKPEDRRRVRKDIKEVLDTPTTVAYMVKTGKDGETKTIKDDQPMFRLVDVYDNLAPRDTLILDDESSTGTIGLLISKHIFYQMQRGGDKRYRPKLMTEDKLTPEERQRYQGYKLRVWEYIYMKNSESTKDARHLEVKGLRSSIGGRPKDQLKKLKEALNTFEEDRHIRAWEFTNRRDEYGKEKQNLPFVRIDFSGTHAFRKAISYYSNKSDKTRDAEVKQLQKDVRILERKTEDY